MKHLVIKNLGPIANADLELKKINVIVGPQSSGKSCVLKTACHCTWMEKRIELAQSAEYFKKDDTFIRTLVDFHKLHGYVKENTYIEYESDFMLFSYNNANKRFIFKWKKDRWNYSRSRITYIPTERNMASVIPNWFNVKLAEDNIRDFMGDWEDARKATIDEIEVLNLGVKYYYDPLSNKDFVVVDDGVKLELTNTSSGLQSLIPLFVHLNYIDKLQFKIKENESISKLNEKKILTNMIYNELFVKQTEQPSNLVCETPYNREVQYKVGNSYFLFETKNSANKFEAITKRFVNNYRCDIFLEEPELNLFPPTETYLIEWLLDIVDGEHPGTLFVSTHSPYVVTSFLEKKGRNDIGLLFTKNPYAEGKISVIVASKYEKQQIYDCGVDVFFNNELFF